MILFETKIPLAHGCLIRRRKKTTSKDYPDNLQHQRKHVMNLKSSHLHRQRQQRS